MATRVPTYPASSAQTPNDALADALLPDSTVRDALYQQFARIGQAIANPTRLHLLALLDQCEKSVETLTAQSGHPFATVSAHLKVLRDAHLVRTRRDGRHIYYQVADDDTVRLCSALRAVAERALPEVRDVVRTYYNAPDSLTSLDAREVLAAVGRCEVLVVDLRPPDEFAAGHLPHARSVPFAELERQLVDLPTDRPILVYCRGPYCVMGVQGVELLRLHGFDAKRLPYGVADWRASGLTLAH